LRRWEDYLVTPQRLPNPALVGKPATWIAKQVGITVPDTTRALIAPLTGVGRDYPLSIEKLCPVLSYYVVKDWHEGCERCIQILRYGGMGHTMSIHSKNEDVILQFGLKKPAFRICVNTPTTHGSIGLTTGLDPAMTLGCGGWGGNITSDNISPKHLLNIKRLAYEVRPAVRSGSRIPDPGSRPAALPKPPSRPEPAGIPAQTLTARIDSFLESRGYRAPADKDDHTRSAQAGSPALSRATADMPVTFVCEDDVRAAMKAGRKVLIDEKTIVTPSARDLGEAQKLFVHAGWPR
jgi:acetaldehyde dehydrogenase (acetylating)